MTTSCHQRDRAFVLVLSSVLLRQKINASREWARTECGGGPEMGP